MKSASSGPAWNWSPGRCTYWVSKNPTMASMATRPCLISAAGVNAAHVKQIVHRARKDRGLVNKDSQQVSAVRKSAIFGGGFIVSNGRGECICYGGSKQQRQLCEKACCDMRGSLRVIPPLLSFAVGTKLATWTCACARCGGLVRRLRPVRPPASTASLVSNPLSSPPKAERYRVIS